MHGRLYQKVAELVINRNHRKKTQGNLVHHPILHFHQISSLIADFTKQPQANSTHQRMNSNALKHTARNVSIFTSQNRKSHKFT
jgi:gamma-glutamyl-gamma-aminobutyrate hydrolase PuuD